jgi:hypothetical protein
MDEAERDALFKEAGLERRYYLAGHPAWPDPLKIWPPTRENAIKVYEANPHPEARLFEVWEQTRLTLLRSGRSEAASE